MKNKKQLKISEMSRSETVEVHGGGVIDAINNGIKAYKALREFFSGRPQI